MAPGGPLVLPQPHRALDIVEPGLSAIVCNDGLYPGGSRRNDYGVAAMIAATKRGATP